MRIKFFNTTDQSFEGVESRKNCGITWSDNEVSHYYCYKWHVFFLPIYHPVIRLNNDHRGAS